MVYELERVLRVCDVLKCSMTATYDGAVNDMTTPVNGLINNDNNNNNGYF